MRHKPGMDEGRMPSERHEHSEGTKNNRMRMKEEEEGKSCAGDSENNPYKRGPCRPPWIWINDGVET